MINEDKVTISGERYLFLLDCEKLVKNINNEQDETFFILNIGSYNERIAIKSKDEVVKLITEELNNYKKLSEGFFNKQDRLEKAFAILSEKINQKK